MTTYSDLRRPRSAYIEVSLLNENILELIFFLAFHFIAYYLGYYIVCSVTLAGIYYSVIKLYLHGRSENVYEEISDDEYENDEGEHEPEDSHEVSDDDMPGLEPISQEDRVNQQLQEVVDETHARNSKRAYDSTILNTQVNVDMGTQIKTALKQLQEMIDSTRQVAEMQKRLQEENDMKVD